MNNDSSFRVLDNNNQDEPDNKKEPPPPIMFNSKIPAIEPRSIVLDKSNDLFLFESSSLQAKNFHKIDILDMTTYNEAHGFIKLKEKEDKEYLAHHHNLFERNIPFIFSTPPPPQSLISSNKLTPQINQSKDFLDNQIKKILNEFKIEREQEYTNINTRTLNYHTIRNNTSSSLNIGPLIPNTYEYYRSSYNDGDSFYRAFMFGYIEQRILDKNNYVIMKLIYDIYSNKLTFDNRNYEANYKEVFSVLDIILFKMENDSTADVIQFFNRTYCMLDNLAKTLIKYMKIKIASFLKQHHNLINLKHFIDHNSISKAYINPSTNKFNDVNTFINEHITVMETEPEPFIFYIIPFVFPGIELTIIPDGEAKEQFLVYQRYIPDNSKLLNKCDIILLYTNAAYNLIYSDKKRADLGYTKITRSVTNKKTYSDKEVKCLTCNKLNGIEFEKLNQILCKDCLYEKTKLVILERVRYFIDEHYSNLEYYIRPIKLSHKDKQLELTDLDIKVLFNDDYINSIYRLFLFYVKSTCHRCGVVYNKEDVESIILECGCRMCKNCVGNHILRGTNGEIVLNVFEKKKYELQSQLCLCNKEFNVDNAIKKVYNDNEIEKFTIEAKERLKDYLKRYCLICEKKLADKGDDLSAKGLKFINISDEDVNEFNKEHAICFECFEYMCQNRNKRNVNNDNDKKDKNEKAHNNMLEVNCMVCCKIHIVKAKIFSHNISCNSCNVF